MNRVALRVIAPLALMALIFYLSSQEDVGPDTPDWVGVAAHFTEYALLAGLWVWALAPQLGRRTFAVAAAISLLYAISDEYHQSFVPGRDADPLDVLVDALGIAFALALVLSRVRSRRTARHAPAPPA